MQGKRIVFCGPSVHGFDSSEFAGLDRQGPAGCGDILAAAQQDAALIGLIDGYFESSRAVWHKEILFALSRGIPVLGAASLGALRATECEAFGMVGIGKNFQDYRSGRRYDDADVAVVHGPAELDYLPLSLSLADCDHCLDRLTGQFEATLIARIKEAARQMHYSDRTWRSIAEATTIPDVVIGECEKMHAAGSLKNCDSKLLLKQMREPEAELVLIEQTWDLQATAALDLIPTPS